MYVYLNFANTPSFISIHKISLKHGINTHFFGCVNKFVIFSQFSFFRLLFRCHIGSISQSRNDVDGALEKYQEIALTEPDIPELWNNIGLCFFKKKQQKVIAVGKK